MFEISFNNYGYSNDTYKECRDLIVASNRRFLICIVSCLFFVISVYLALSLSNLLGYTSSQIKYYAAYLTATFIVGACLIFFPVIVEKIQCIFCLCNDFPYVLVRNTIFRSKTIYAGSNISDYRPSLCHFLHR